MDTRAQQLADALVAKWTAPAGVELMAAGATVLGQIMGEGPLPVRDAAAVLGWPDEDVLRRFDAMDFRLELNSKGDIAGAGLSLLPSAAHTVEINGTRYHGWCAMDVLMFPIVFGNSSPAASRCAATGDRIHLTVTADGLKDLDPADTHVTLAPATGGEVREVFCNRVNFYGSGAAAAAAAAADPDLAVCTAAEAWAVAKRLAALF
ncbi:organomercurial lyase [Streptomycetaceae bacterium NBC_01309]